MTKQEKKKEKNKSVSGWSKQRLLIDAVWKVAVDKEVDVIASLELDEKKISEERTCICEQK